jgi:DNA-binding LacI/PurR family transcriptional regulator
MICSTVFEHKELGMRCPKDVSVTGFDDLELDAFTSPPLTSVAQPGYQMGARAAELLLGRIHGSDVHHSRWSCKAAWKWCRERIHRKT